MNLLQNIHSERSSISYFLSNIVLLPCQSSKSISRSNDNTNSVHEHAFATEQNDEARLHYHESPISRRSRLASRY